MAVQSDFLKNLLKQNHLETMSSEQQTSTPDYLDTKENEDFLNKIKSTNMTLNFNFNETRFDSNAAEPEYLKMRHPFNQEPERSVFGQLN